MMENFEMEDLQDPDMFNDFLRAKDEIKSKRAAFEEGIDKSMSQDERDLMMERFDNSMREMELALQREQEEQ
jgi:hypothetical protein